MSLRNILVHLDGGARSPERLHLAAKISQRNSSRLVGVFAQRAAAHRVGVVATWPSEAYTRRSEANRRQFAEATKGHEKAEWIDLNRGGEQQILQQMTNLARYFDLVILGQDEEGEARQVPADLVDQIILEAGRPVLVIPYAGSYADVGLRPLIAWTDSRAAARALNDAIPLMQSGCEATIVSFIPGGGAGPASIEQLGTHLACHGVGARSDTLVVEDVGVMDMLLNRAADYDSDLLVAGAFGGYAFPLLSRGSGTRFLLRHMTLPVLFSH